MGGPLNDEPDCASFLYLARYAYTSEVQENNNLLRVFPRSDGMQYAQDCRFLTIPHGRDIQFSDAYDNPVRRSHIEDAHTELVIASAGRVRLYPLLEYPPDMPLSLALTSQHMLPEFVTPSPMVDPDRLRDAALQVTRGTDTLLQATSAIVNWIYQNVRYERGVTSVVTRAEEVYESRQGVCQDMAHLALGMMRSLWIPARYVSGLLVGEPGQTHAWVEFWHPEEGWISADPTHNIPVVTGPDHVRFAVGRDYTDVAPVLGEFIAAGTGRLDAVVAEAKLEGETQSLEEAIETVLAG